MKVIPTVIAVLTALAQQCVSAEEKEKFNTRFNAQATEKVNDNHVRRRVNEDDMSMSMPLDDVAFMNDGGDEDVEAKFFDDAGNDGEGEGKVVAEIIGGEEASKGEFPYLTYFVMEKLAGVFQCTASLIDPGVVLTAAHCVTDTKQFLDKSKIIPNPKYGQFDLEVGSYIKVGAYDIRDECDSEECKEYQVCEKENGVGCDEGLAYVVRHPKYNPPDNDFALIFLPTPADGIVPISINPDANTPANNDALVTAGFGVIDEDKDETPNVPYKVTVQYLPNVECNDLYRERPTDVTENEMCAAAPGKDTCQGDSGGPLMKKRSDGSSIQVGVTSFGVGCAKSEYPGVSARISTVYQWIASASCNNDVQAFCPSRTPTKKPSGKGTSSPVVAAKTSKEADSYTKDEIDAMISRQSDEIAVLNLEIDGQSDEIAVLNLEIAALKSCLRYEASSNVCVLEATNNVFINSVKGDITLTAGKGKVESYAGDGCTGTCFPAP